MSEKIGGESIFSRLKLSRPALALLSFLLASPALAQDDLTKDPVAEAGPLSANEIMSPQAIDELTRKIEQGLKDPNVQKALAFRNPKSEKIISDVKRRLKTLREKLDGEVPQY